MNDTDEFKHSCVAMDVCGVKVEERANIFRIISAILHLNFILNNKKYYSLNFYKLKSNNIKLI